MWTNWPVRKQIASSRPVSRNASVAAKLAHQNAGGPLDLATLLPQFGGLAFTIVAFIGAISVIVAVHEYGHYIVGRWSGIFPEVFSLGFGPVLWSRVDKRGTRWQIAAIPMGGFVKFLGDADAASGKDAEAMAAAEQDPERLRKTMHGAPLWARAATVAAGPVFNFVLSAFIFAGLFMWQGKPVEDMIVGGLKPVPGVENGLEVGDEILSVGGVAVPKRGDPLAWQTFEKSLPDETVLTYVVDRNGQDREVRGPHIRPAFVSLVTPRGAADDVGMAPGDFITHVDGAPIASFDALREAVFESEGRPILVDVLRDGKELQFALAARRTDLPTADGGFETRWLVGLQGGLMFDFATEPMAPWSALGLGAISVWSTIEGTFSGISHMVSGQISTCNLSGPIGIAETSGSLAGQSLINYIGLIAALSTAIGLINLFPVPILDGGHLMFFAYEAITGRQPNQKVMQALMALGVVMVLSLMVFSIGNDLFC